MPKFRNSLNVDPDDKDPLISRRSFLAMMGVGACLIGAGQLVGASVVGFLYPNAMKIPPSIFSIGRPEEILSREGKFFYPKQKVFIESTEGKGARADGYLHSFGMYGKYGADRLCMSLPWINL